MLPPLARMCWCLCLQKSFLNFPSRLAFLPCCGSAAVVSVGGIGWQYRALSCCLVKMLCTHHITLLVYLSVFDNPVVIVHLSVLSLSVVDWFDCHVGNLVRGSTRSSLIAGETWSWLDHDACCFVMISCLSSVFFAIRRRIGLGNHGVIVTPSSGQEPALFLNGCETTYGGIEGQDFSRWHS